MKIIYVSNSRFPSERAHSVQIVHMCNAFSQHGHDVELLVTNRDTCIKDAPSSYYGCSIDFKITYIPVPDMVAITEHLPLFLRPLVYSIQRIFFVFQANRQIPKDTTIFYGRDEWILFLLSIFRRRQVVWESHEARFNLATRYLLKYARSVIVISSGIKEFYLKKIPYYAKDVVVAPDAVDESFFNQVESRSVSQARLGISSTKPVVMYIGGLDEWKGVDVLFKTAEISDTFSVYVIGGKLTELDSYRIKYPKVFFLGPRPYRELKNNQRAADVLVIPNTAENKLSSEYTSPLKLFAHLASGVPIAVADLPSMRCIVNEGHVYFFQPDTPNSLIACIETILSDNDLSRQKTTAAHVLSKKYTWQARANVILQSIK